MWCSASPSLAHQAWMMVDAIARPLVRVYITQATPPRMDDRCPGEGQATASTWRRSTGRWRAASAIAIVDRCRSSQRRSPSAVWIAAPFVLLWLLSPLMARWVSLPAAESPAGAALGRRRRDTPPDRPSHVAVLRNVRRPRKTTGCRPTTSRTTRARSSRIAPRRPTSGCTCWRP